MNKLQHQASAKADLSYSYWAANAAGEAPPPQPKQLTEEEAHRQQQKLKHTEGGASAWNAAGTFEERPISLDWVKEQLAQLLPQMQHSHQGAEVAMVEVMGCGGEAHQWIVRGKKRAGFELTNIEFTWRVQLAGAGVAVVCGKAKVPHAAADELDELQLEVTPDAATAAGCGSGDAAAHPSEEQRQQARAAVHSMLPRLEEVLQQLLERVQQK